MQSCIVFCNVKNTGALMAAASATSVNKDMETSMERLSTGKRINSAKDDAAGVAIASRLTSEIRGTNQAIRNAQDGQALINTAEGAHKEIENILQRMRELAVQSSNDTNDTADRANLQLEVDALITEIDRISQTTTWAGQSLLNGTAKGALATSFDDKATFNLQVGANSASANVITANIGATTSAALGLGATASSSSSAASSDNPARMSIDGGTITVEGDLVNGDSFSFDINDIAVSVTYSTTDEYTNDLAGLGAQLKDKVDALVAAGTITSPVSVTNNGDGSISLSVSDTPTMDTLVASQNAASSTTAISVTGNTIAVTGTFAYEKAATEVVTIAAGDVTDALAASAAAGDSFSLTVGTTVLSYTAGTADDIDDLVTGLTSDSDYSSADFTVAKDSAGTGLLVTSKTTGAVDFGTVTLATVGTAGTSAPGSVTTSGAGADEISASINGVTVTYSAAANDGFARTNVGAASGLATAIGNQAGLENVTVVDNGDGTISLSQSTTPVLEAAEVALNNAGAASISYDDAGVITVGGSFVDGKSYSFNLFGEDISITASTDDGFADSKEGIAAQIAEAINSAGIHGVTAAKTANATSVTLTAKVAVENTNVASGSQFLVATTGLNATATLNISSDTSATTASAEVGNVTAAAANYAVTGDIATLTVGSVELSFTTTTTSTTLDALITGLQAHSDYSASGFTIAADTAGTGINITYGTTGSRVDDEINFSTTGDTPSSTTGSITTQGVATAVDGKGITAATYTAGDSYSFDVAGQSFSLVVGADGYNNDKDGVSQQMMDLINDAGIAGLTVVANKGDSAGVSITRALTGVTSGSGGSTVLENVVVMDAAGQTGTSSASNAISITEADSATSALSRIDTAIASLTSQRASLGAVSNRIDSTVSNLTNVAINLEGGRGRIEDADFAAESTALSKSQILAQASTAMLAQANASKQSVLSLLQG